MNSSAIAMPFELPKKKKYKRWNTNVKKFIANGGDPKIIKFPISKSNICRWRKQKNQVYIDLDSCDDNFKRVVSFVRNDAIVYYHKLSCQVTLIFKSILFSFKNGKKLFNDAKQFIVQKIDEFKEKISLRNAVELFGISEYIYFTWKTGKFCLESAFGVCVKRWPNQLLNEEVKNIENYINKNEYKNWPSISVYYQGKRDGVFAFDDSTFYRYLHLLGIEKNMPKNRKKIIFPVSALLCLMKSGMLILLFSGLWIIPKSGFILLLIIFPDSFLAGRLLLNVPPGSISNF